MTRTRIALIGTGGIAQSHVNAVRAAADRAELIAVVDINRQTLARFADEHHIDAQYTDVGAMLAAEHPDLVLICTPPQVHCELSIQAMEAGAWVLCEKPLVASLAELDQIEAAQARTGLYTSSVFQWRYGSGAQHLKHLIDDAAVGRPLLGICQTTWYRDEAYYAVPWRGTWASELGGVTMGHGIHAMDMFLWLFGEWTQVSAMMGTLNHAIEVEDVSLAHVRFANGAMGSIINSVISPRQVSYVRMDFERATVELEHLYAYSNQHWRYSTYDGGDDEALRQWATIDGDAPGSHAAQLAHILDCMQRDEEPLTSCAGVRSTLEFIASLYKSAMTGTPVQRGSIAVDDPYYTHMCGLC